MSNNQTFKPGQRVRYTGGHPGTNYDNNRIGDIGTVRRHSDSNVDVDWDANVRRRSGVFPENLTLVLDLTKPLAMTNTYGDNDPVTLLGTDPDGDLIIASKKGVKDWEWAIFKASDGSFKRSPTGSGTGLRLVNSEPVKSTQRVATMFGVIEFAMLDGVAQSAELVK